MAPGQIIRIGIAPEGVEGGFYYKGCCTVSRTRYITIPFKSLLLIVLLVGESASAREVLVFGGSERPWQAWGTVQAIDMASRPGWLQPERILPDENLSLRALAEGGNIDSPQPSVRGLADPPDWPGGADRRENRHDFSHRAL